MNAPGRPRGARLNREVEMLLEKRNAIVYGVGGGVAIAEITTFDAALFPALGLPPAL